MKAPYARPIIVASPDIGLPEPRVAPWVLSLARSLSGAYLRLALGFERVTVMGGEGLVEAFRAAFDGERRIVLAFRHPYGDEPQLLSWVFTRGTEREARRLGVRLRRRPHAVFVHGYEVPRWGGALVRWILPRVGAMPVHHSKMDSAGLGRIYAAALDGPYPLALSPEGQVSYTSDDVPRLEAGAVRIGFRSADRLERAGRRERVAIVPVSVHYRYGPRAWASLERLLRRTEAFVGAAGRLPGAIGGDRGDGAGYGDRAAAILEAVLSLAERQYGIAAPVAVPARSRVEAVVEAALRSGERLLGIERGSGDAIERLYRIRQIGWDRVYLPPEEYPRRAPPLVRAALDRRAGEAWYAMRHMELADFAFYFSAAPPRLVSPPTRGGRDGGPDHALVEYAQNLWDFANRLAGGAISGRLNVRPKRAVVIIAPAIDVSSRLDEYRADRKEATASALEALDASYRACIMEMAELSP